MRLAKKVLVADDEPSMRLLLRAALDGQDVRILEAADGRQALELAAEERPDLIVLDVFMPHMTGLEVAAALKRRPATSSISVILMSANARPEGLPGAAAVAPAAYVTKPFSPGELLQRILALLAMGDRARPRPAPAARLAGQVPR